MPVIIALFKFADYRLNKVLRYTAILLLAAVVWSLADILMNYDSLRTMVTQAYFPHM